MTLAMYVAITVLAQGILPRVDIAAMANPSMAGVLAHMVGPWGKVLISSCLIVSVLSSYLSWTLYATEIPHMGARNGAFPKSFIPLNKKRSAAGFVDVYHLDRAVLPIAGVVKKVRIILLC